jgi:hypothetical protein
MRSLNMLTDSTQALQTAITDRLLAGDEIKAIVDDRIYDRIPNGPVFPDVSFGKIQILPELAEGTDAAKAFATLHAWDRFMSSTAKTLSRLIIAALHDADLVLSEGKVQSCCCKAREHCLIQTV